MAKDINKIFKIILIICVIILIIAISFSLIYYYVFFRPANEKAKWMAQLEWEKEKLKKEELKKLEEKNEELIKKRALAKCLDEADETYREMWDEEVKRFDSEDNTLPTDIAEYLSKIREKRYEDCYKFFGSD